MMSSWSKNLTSAFAILLLLHLWPCSSGMQSVDDHEGNAATRNSEDSNISYNEYVGCFSKSIMERMVTEMKGQVILNYPTINFTLQGFLNNACQDYFDQFPSSQLNVIAIQHQVAICVPIYPSYKPIHLQKLPDSECTLKAPGNVNVGGPFSFALYSQNKAQYVSYFILRELNLFEISKVWPKVRYNSENDFMEIQILESYQQNPCEMESCTLRNMLTSGVVCNSSLKVAEENSRTALVSFLSAYTPNSEKMPSYCVKYCTTSNMWSVDIVGSDAFVDENGPAKVAPPNYAIQSKTFDKLDPLELCSCTDDLTMIIPLDVQTCSLCQQSQMSEENLCFSNLFTHKILSNSQQPNHPTRQKEDIPNDPKKPQGCPDSKKCKGKDSYGQDWMACPLVTESRDCPPSSASGGHSFWTCSADGKFQGEQPDFSNCTSQELLRIEKDFMMTGFGPNTIKPKEVLLQFRDLVTQAVHDDMKGAKYFGHNIESISNIAKSAVGTPNSDFREREVVIKTAIDVLVNLIATNSPWKQLNPRSRAQTCTNLITSIEDSLFEFANTSEKEISESSSNGVYRKTINPISTDPEGFKVTLGTKAESATESIKFPENSKSYIKIADNSQFGREKLKYVGVMMKSKYVKDLTASNLQSNEGLVAKNFNSMIVSLTFSDNKINQMVTEKGAEIKLIHEVESVGRKRIDFRRKLHPGEKKKSGETKCAYWNTTLLLWATDGCVKLEDPSNSRETICKCNHLTAFAVLADLHGYIGKDKGLEIITLILCPLSIFCLIATCVIVTRMKVLHGERSTITKHLCANLIIGNLLMLLFVDRNYFDLLPKFCVAVGIITHYVFLAAFGWMAVQGLYLYRMVVLIFDSGKNYMPYYTIGAYGVPLLPVVITAAIGYGKDDPPYGGEMYCWLKGDYIWAFMGPVAVVLFGNCIVMILTLRTVQKQNKSKIRTKRQLHSNRKWLQGCFALSVLLGLTWITGFFTLLDEPDFYFMSYIFTISNASQGIFIFIFYCLLHEKVKPLVWEKVFSSVLSNGKDKDTQSSSNFSKKTSSTRVPAFNSHGTENQSQSEVIDLGDHENDELSENEYETSEANGYDESPPPNEPFSRRVLSTVLESHSELESDESESDPLPEARKPRPKPRKQRRIEEETENDDSDENSLTEVDQNEQKQGRKKPRCFKGPPYMDELLESSLFRQFSKSDANSSADE